MRVRVKICGVTDVAGVDAAAAAGADAVGFVFAPSPRRLDPARAHALAAGVPPGLSRVAVFQHPSAAEVAAVLDRFRPDWVQTEVEDWGSLALPPGVGFLPVFHDGPNVEEEVDRFLAACPAPGPTCLFEAAESGRGQRPDWSRAASLAERTRLVLAGGLDPANVGDAIRRVRPYAVDVSSGVESRPGEKDPVRVAAFVAAVRLAERERNLRLGEDEP